MSGSTPAPATAPASASRSASPPPMAKTASSGSNPASKDAAAAGSGTASPYGTRSRNRSGASRPNYAEDKDIDMEFFENYPERKEDESKKLGGQGASVSTRSQLQEGPPPRTSNGAARKPLPTEDSARLSAASNQQPPQTSAKEPHPKAPTPPSSVANGQSNGAAATSKKRKATTQAVTSSKNAPSQSSQPQPPPPQTSVTLRRTGQASHRARGYAETNMLTFENCGAKPKNGRLVADDGTILQVNDNVYLVCEPPGEPYYLARIMEFMHHGGDSSNAVDYLRVNWFYRPKDISRSVHDTRLVFATMHSDTCPLTSLRGKCQIKHKSEIADIAEYKRQPDCFWYEKLYDRYIQKMYEIIPTSQIVNVPERVKSVLDERWKFVLVEQGRGKELTSAAKLCTRCRLYCPSNDSVDCAVCGSTYHMKCVRPPLLKKPSRGFAWSCAACSRAQEKKLEARNTPNILDPASGDVEEEEYIDDEEEEVAGIDTGRTSPSGGDATPHPPATAEQIYHASLWPYRYLGMHCKPEDALDYDDRIYPRASSRLGPRHQATVVPWYGRPVTYVKPPPEVKKRKDGKVPKDVQAMLEKYRIERETRPKHIQDEPRGFVARGEDLDNDDPNNTAQLLWKPTTEVGSTVTAAEVDEYMTQARAAAPSLGLPEHSTNLSDVARDVLFKNKFDVEKSLKELPKIDRADFKEPELNAAEQKKFEEGVGKFGSELLSVKRHVKTVSPGNIVRYYYTWKKTERGKQIWGNYSGRKGKKESRKAEATASKLQDDVADDHDDSAFDTDKANEKKRAFCCKFCLTKSSRQWRRAPVVNPRPVAENGAKIIGKDKSVQYVQALCRRCAELWRRYAIQWEDLDEVAKKVAQTGGRSWRRRVDEELIKELMAADEMMSNTQYSTPDPATASADSRQALGEPARKRLKGMPDKESEPNGSDSSSVSGIKKKEKTADKPPAAPPIPEIPKPKVLPCAICRQQDTLGADQYLTCRDCRLAVHRHCYGVMDNRAAGKWICDMCSNDKSPHVSIDYKCVLCPVEHTDRFVLEPPKPTSHKKKTDKDRDREKRVQEEAQESIEYYRRRQEELGRPLEPREPLKRTADNNWVHVTCAVWTPEVKFGSAKALSPSEGIPSIPRARYGEVCQACNRTGGACVACHHCRAAVHVECANQGGFLLGFEITPVKGSRRDQFSIVSVNGETGTMSAAIWCKEHVPTKTIVHHMHDVVEGLGLTALQVYVQNYKQADLTLTGCARKANQISLASRMTTGMPITAHNRRASTTTVAVHLTNGIQATSPTAAAAAISGSAIDGEDDISATQTGTKVCLTCGIDVSPKWYDVDEDQQKGLVNGHYGTLGAEALKFVEQRGVQCHKCRKSNRQPSMPEAHKGLSRGPSPEPSRAPRTPLPAAVPGTAPAAASPPRPVEVNGHTARPAYAWTTPPAQAAPLPPQMMGPGVAPPGAYPPSAAPPPGVPVVAAPVAAPQPPPMQANMVAPHAGHPLPMMQGAVAPPPLPTTIAPRAPPPPQGPYASVSGMYDDWQRPDSRHGHGHPHQAHSRGHGHGHGHGHTLSHGHGPHAVHGPAPINGAMPVAVAPSAVPPPPLAPPGHLRAPSLGGLPHLHAGPPPPAPVQNGGHMVQPPPLVNGLPPSPRRISGPPPPMSNGGPYMNIYHHGPAPLHAPPPPPPHSLMNGGPPPPRVQEHPFGHAGQRPPYVSALGSPPVSRDGLPMGYDHAALPNLPPPPRDNRPSGGASSSPSLRNLLS